MDDSSYRRNFDLEKKNESITIAGKSILKWVKLQHLVANSLCKMRKIHPCEFRKCCIYLQLREGKITIFEPAKVVIFTSRKTIIYKICELHRAIFSSFYNILVTDLCSFTHSKTLFLAVVLDFMNFMNLLLINAGNFGPCS